MIEPFPVRLDESGHYCADCGGPIYESGCGACEGLACPDCGTGCDLDFLPDDESWCAGRIMDA